MKTYLAFPPARRLSGSVRVPSSKSATNRALLLAALSGTPVTVVHPLDAGDTRALLRCLEAMGARIAPVADGVTLHGPLSGGPGVTVLDAGDSGTAARFLVAMAAATRGTFRITGSGRLRERPMGELVSALRSLGAAIEEEAPGCLPLLVRGGSLSGGPVAVDASRSSQFLSALMLLGAAGVDVEVRATGAVASAPYAALTAESLRAFGHRVDGDGDGDGDGTWRVARGDRAPDRYDTPGDFSSAVPLMAAVGVRGGDLFFPGLAWPSPQADALAVPVLRGMGLAIAAERGGLAARCEPGALSRAAVRATRFPDAVPSLAALAAFAPGESRFEGVGHLRWKESDRLASICEVLAGAGAVAVADSDGLTVRGGFTPTPSTGVLSTFRDHRIAMAAGILSVGRPGLLIEDPGCVEKSYPAFFRDLDSLCER